jgi:hypothetical protein
MTYPGKAGVQGHGILALDPVHHVEIAHLVLSCCSNVCDPKNKIKINVNVNFK